MKKTLLFILMSLASCELETTLPSKGGLPGIAAKSGRLVFENVLILQQAVNSLAALNEESVAKWEKNFDGFVSLRANLQSRPIMTEVDETAYPRSLLSVANQHGLYQIGGRVYLLAGEREYSIDADNEMEISEFVRNPDGVEGAYVHTIRREVFGPPQLSVDQMAGFGIYEQETIKDCHPNGQMCISPTFPVPPPPSKHKFLYESYGYEFSAYIVVGVRLRFQKKNRVSIGYPCFAYLPWGAAPEVMHRKMTAVKFRGFIYDPSFGVWESLPSTIETYSSQDLVLEKMIVANCIDDFTITGALHMDSNGQTFCGNSYIVNSGNPGAVLWNSIRFCRSGYIVPGGGGGGGGGGGVEDPSGPPQGGCGEGCVWTGIECTCA